MKYTLDRRYRRLLLAYPRAYRRSRGDEIVDTLLDITPAGRTRPPLRIAVNLVRNGLRSRLGRPASRSIVVVAALVAVISGLFTAAAATRLAWETSRPPPDRAEAMEILSTALPGHPIGNIYVPPALFTIYGQPLGMSNVDTLLSLDGGEYQLSSTGVSLNGTPPVSLERTLFTAENRLRDAGWYVYAPVVTNAVDCAVPDCNGGRPLPTDTTLIASRRDTVLTLELISQSREDTTYLSASLSRATPPAVYPAGIAGGLVGAVIAWLLVGWASRRTEGRRAISALLKPLVGAVIALWWGPAVLAAPFLVAHHLREPHPSWHPLWEWLGQPTFSTLFLLGAACALVGLALALPRRATTGSPTGVPAAGRPVTRGPQMPA